MCVSLSSDFYELHNFNWNNDVIACIYCNLQAFFNWLPAFSLFSLPFLSSTAFFSLSLPFFAISLHVPYLSLFQRKNYQQHIKIDNQKSKIKNANNGKKYAGRGYQLMWWEIIDNKTDTFGPKPTYKLTLKHHILTQCKYTTATFNCCVNSIRPKVHPFRIDSFNVSVDVTHSLLGWLFVFQRRIFAN